MKIQQSREKTRSHFDLRKPPSWFSPSLLLMLTLTLTSCGKFTYRFLYSNADYFLLKQADFYFDIHETQEELLKKDFKKIIFWHKTKELSNYLHFIKFIQGMMNVVNTNSEQLNKKWVLKIIDKLTVFKNNIYYRLEPSLLGLLLTLSDEQIKFFEETIQNNDKKTYEKNFSIILGDQIRDRAKRIIKRLENWFGELNSNQKKMLERFIQDNPSAALLWFEENKRNKKKIIDALENKLSERILRKRLRSLFRIDHSSILHPKKWADDSIKLIVNFLQVATKKQKKFFNHELNTLAENIRYLVKN